MRWLDSITNSMHMNLSKLRRWWRTRKAGMLQSMRLQRIEHYWATEQQQQQHGITAMSEFKTVYFLRNFFNSRDFGNFTKLLKGYYLYLSWLSLNLLKNRKTNNEEISMKNLSYPRILLTTKLSQLKRFNVKVISLQWSSTANPENFELEPLQ